MKHPPRNAGIFPGSTNRKKPAQDQPYAMRVRNAGTASARSRQIVPMAGGAPQGWRNFQTPRPAAPLSHKGTPALRSSANGLADQ